MGYRTCYPEIHHLSILNVLNWRSLRKQKQGGHSGLSRQLLPWNRLWFQGLICERCPLYTRKGVSFSLETNDAQKNLNKYVLLIFPQVTTLTSYSWPITFLHNCPLVIKPSIKILRSVSLGLSFLKKPPLSHESYIKFVCFSPVTLPLSV